VEERQPVKTAVVTGATSGIGFAIASALLAQGIKVVLISRDLERGQRAIADLVARHPGCDVQVEKGDLGSLASVAECGDNLARSLDRLDLLVNNAGIMGGPFQVTEDGFESSIATNHLGHFLLSARLFPRLVAAPGARVVTVTSGRVARATIDATAMDAVRVAPPGWSAMAAYDTSKLAMLIFAVELQRRASAARVDVRSVAASPGLVATGIGSRALREAGHRYLARLVEVASRALLQSPSAGARSVLVAATDDALIGGEFMAPSRFGHTRGIPRIQPLPDAARDQSLGELVWRWSERATGVSFEGLLVSDG
jgi:NAD(P)-dependent dehydrogenase (short-subunit alcohol dehydrogenase family)